MADHTGQAQDKGHGGEHTRPGQYHPHVVSLPLLTGVFVALLVLTFITVEVTRYEWGMWDLAIALLIAAVKASLVALYFMHLRWDSPFNGLVTVAAFMFLALFLWFTILDTGEYQPQKQPTIEREGLAPQLDAPAADAGEGDADGAGDGEIDGDGNGEA